MQRKPERFTQADFLARFTLQDGHRLVLPNRYSDNFVVAIETQDFRLYAERPLTGNEESRMLMLAIFAGYAPEVNRARRWSRRTKCCALPLLTFTNSIKQSPDAGLQGRGGSQVTRKPPMRCDDGDGPRLLLAHLQDLEFGQQGAFVEIRILCRAIWRLGVEVQVARRKAVWAAALATSGANPTAGGAGFAYYWWCWW
ncbi:hypothetical protein ACF2JD_07915 [Aeromonas sp. A-5]|uniref:hypothetical protein n=1 Tax=Aeromonas ichthyocola TaxID=3367746 RepID=UPI0038E0DE6C